MKSLPQIRSDKPFVNFFSWIGMTAVLLLIASAPAAVAQNYDFTFTSSALNASGTINIVGGVAQTGSIFVTDVPIEADPNTFITASGSLLPASGVENVENHNGDVVTYDNLVNFANDPILDGNGLGFGAGPYQDSSHYNTLIGLNGGDPYGNYAGPGVYTLFVGEAELDGNGNVIPGEDEYVYTYNEGSMTFNPIVPAPEPSTDALIILGALTVGFEAIRRRRAAA